MKIKFLLFSLCAVFISALKADAQIGKRWYSYSDYQYYNTATVDVGYLQLWKDTAAVYGYYDPTSTPAYYLNGFTSDGLSFAPVLNGWNSAATYGSTIKVGPADAYTIDSVRVYGAYLRNNAKPLIKDTLRLAFVYGNGLGTTNLPQYDLWGGTTPGLYGVDTLKFLEMAYDSVKEIAGKYPSVATTPYVQSIVLGVPDTSSSFSRSIALTTPYSVPAGSAASMSLTFKTGDAAYTPFDTIQYASGAMKYGDFFSLIQFAGSSITGPVFPNYDTADKNVGFFGSPTVENNFWEGFYIPTWAWTYGGTTPTEIQYPVIEYHINCPTCDLNDSITGTMSVCAGSTSALAFSTTGGTWSSSNTAVATVVSGTGVVSGVSGGTVTITYNISGHHAYGTFTVNALPTAFTGSLSVCAGGATTVLGTIPSGGTWTSGTTSVAGVSSSGTVTGHIAGTTVVTYVAPITGCSRTGIVTVDPLPAAISGTTTVCSGLTTTLSDASSPGTWSSSTTSVAAVTSGGGVVTGVGAGSAIITYTSAGCYVTTFVSVLSTPTSAGTITGAAAVCAGASTTLSDGTASGTWSSSNTAMATVDGSGDVFGVAGGIATITYTVANICGTVSATSPITINPLPDPGLITGTVTVCQGDTASLLDATAGGVWSSSNTSIATVVTSSGLVYGVSAGATNISYSVTNSCGTQSAVQAINVLSLAVCHVGINNTNSPQAAEMTIFPNPNKGIFTMNMSSQSNENVHVVITNIVGEKVNEFTMATNTVTDVKLNQASGIYIITATMGSGNYVARIVIQ